MSGSPFHEGERELQARAGSLEEAALNGRIIDDEIPRGAVTFLARQEMVVLATLDAAGRPRASLVTGEAGLLRAATPRVLEVDPGRARLDPRDALLERLRADPRVGVLAIELATRRRLRVNGTARVEGGRLAIDVEQAYPNCPKYVQKRARAAAGGGVGEGALPPPRDALAAGDPRRLSAEAAALVARADTLFLATRGPDGRLDASHRGGEPGFVSLEEDGALRVPDYAGNGMFNSLGNVARDARAGLLFVDFEGRRLLEVLGRASIEHGAADPRGETGGTGRFWRLRPEEATLLEGARTGGLVLLERSPWNVAPRSA